jgi:hypothetical protein
MKLPHTISFGMPGDFIRYNAYETGTITVKRATLGEDGIIALKYTHDCGDFSGQCIDELEEWVTEDTYFETTQTLANSGGNWLVLDSAVSHPNVKIIIKEQELWNDCFGIKED